MTSANVDTTALDRDGYVVLDGLLDPASLAAVHEATLAALREARDDGPTGTGHGTPTGPAIDALTSAPRLRAVVEHLLGPDAELAGVNVRAPNPGFGAQALHADFTGIPDGTGAQGVIAIVALVDVTEEGGATRVVPGTHTWRKLAPRDTHHVRVPGERRIPLTAGSALVFDGHLWHSGTRNDGPYRRDALQITYTRPGSRVLG
ncbi:Phytanoyl-CoA dioxygenase (PhyH) [Pseudonocardia thermophila]|jgi:Protein involved in biosynthesis of mitomycin antibiotics/polyketide fumonisin|uniref:Phytanoyl-CoA dioxygenase (PhyH) n=1 Tax=Pseudonocardia thermophila TaxID=1848 RepID=A0A1M6Y7I1_PSETH|nr:phytanoyl-CoA dioxygenase family protein [Pseudonocardia thermophila]SHL13975.1 Phytanoyl-CoA dioxygenase (PhyH) [Pseudonocardia thermophila]